MQEARVHDILKKDKHMIVTLVSVMYYILHQSPSHRVIHVYSMPVALTLLFVHIFYPDNNIMTKLQVSASISLQAPHKFIRKVSAVVSWRYKLQK